MAQTTFTTEQFDKNISGAKRAAKQGPVFITERRRRAYVLLAIEDYQRLTGGHMSLAEALGQPSATDFDFDPPKLGRRMFGPADLG